MAVKCTEAYGMPLEASTSAFEASEIRLSSVPGASIKIYEISNHAGKSALVLYSAQ